MPGGVFPETCARPGAAAAALIEHDDAIMQRIEELTRAPVRTRSRAAVEEHRGLAGGVAAFLVVQLVHVRDPQVAVFERLDRRIQLAPLRRPSDAGADRWAVRCRTGSGRGLALRGCA